MGMASIHSSAIAVGTQTVNGVGTRQLNAKSG
jgi:hypothetical protein